MNEHKCMEKLIIELRIQARVKEGSSSLNNFEVK